MIWILKSFNKIFFGVEGAWDGIGWRWEGEGEGMGVEWRGGVVKLFHLSKNLGGSG